MLDINQIRADFAGYLQAHAASKHSLDAALMHVTELAYRKGFQDALQVPAVLTEPIADLDTGLAPGMRSPLAAVAHAGPAPRAPGAPASAGKDGRAQGGNDAFAQKAAGPSQFYGCNRGDLNSRITGCHHAMKASDPACTGCARRDDQP